MIFNESHIKSKARLVIDVINLVLTGKEEVDKIFLIGSYASGKQDESSDIDFLIQLKQPVEWYKPRHWYPTWKQIEEIHKRLDTNRIHVIFGSVVAAESLHQKHKYEKKNYAYREITQGELYAPAHS